MTITPMVLSFETMDADAHRRVAEEKKRLAREQRDARLAAEGRTKLEGIAAAHGMMTGEEGEAFERAFWEARRAGMSACDAVLPD